MKFNKKISIAAIAAAMFVSPIALMEAHIAPQAQTVQATTSLKGKINLLNDYHYPQIYNKNGKALDKQPDINLNKPIKFYGQPKFIKGPKVYGDEIIGMPQAIIKGAEYADLGDGGYIKMNNVGAYDPTTGEFELVRNAYVYDKNGKRLSTYRGQKAYYKWNATNIKYVGKLYTYHPNFFLNIGNGHYINTSNVNNMNGKGVLKLNHNSYVYNKNGQRTTYNGKSRLLKYDLINYSGRKRNKTKADKYYYINETGEKEYSVKNYRIKGQYYYYLGKGVYIKAENIGFINGHAAYRDGGSTYVTPRTDLFVYNSDFKQTKKSVPAGKVIKVDKTTTTGDGDATQRWFRIAGTKGKNAQWLRWGDNSEYGNNLDDEYMGYFYVRTRI